MVNRAGKQNMGAAVIKDPRREFLKMIRPMPLKISDEIGYFFYVGCR